MNQIVKDKYINVLNTLNDSDPAIEDIKTFIQTYNGTNYKEFEMMVLALIKIYTLKQMHQIKAAGYDEIKKANEHRKDLEAEFNTQLEELRKMDVASPTLKERVPILVTDIHEDDSNKKTSN